MALQPGDGKAHLAPEARALGTARTVGGPPRRPWVHLMPDDIVTLHVLRAMSDRLLPPASLILAAAVFCMLAWWRRMALWMLCLSIAALYVLSLSPISAALLS